MAACHFQGISSSYDGMENKVSSLLLLNSSWVRDDGVQLQYQVSSPRCRSDFQGIISRDDGLLFKVSSPKSLVSDD